MSRRNLASGGLRGRVRAEQRKACRAASGKPCDQCIGEPCESSERIVDRRRDRAGGPLEIVRDAAHEFNQGVGVGKGAWRFNLSRFNDWFGSQQAKHVHRRDRNSGVGQHRPDRGQGRGGEYDLAASLHPRRPSMQTDADVRSQSVCNRAKLGFVGTAAIRRCNQAQGCRGVRRTSAEARGNRQILFQPEAAEGQSRREVRSEPSRFQYQIVVRIERVREWADNFEGKRKALIELQPIAAARERNQTAQRVITVGTTP